MIGLSLIDARRALTSVTAFVPTDPEGWVWLIPGSDGLVVTGSSDGQALAAARCASADCTDATPLALTRSDVAKMLAVFPLPKDADARAEAWLDISIKGSEITITDSGGLIEGHSLNLPAAASGAPQHSSKPPHVATFAALAQAPRWPQPDGEHRQLSDRPLGHLSKAIKAHGEPAYLELRGRDTPVLVATVGQHFVAVIAISPPPTDIGTDGEEHERDKPAKWRQAWVARLADLAPAPDPGAPEPARTRWEILAGGEQP